MYFQEAEGITDKYELQNMPFHSRHIETQEGHITDYQSGNQFIENTCLTLEHNSNLF